MKLWVIFIAATLIMGSAAVLALGEPQSNKDANASSENASSEINSTMLKELVLSSETMPTTYSFTMDMKQRIELINYSKENNTRDTQSMLTQSFGAGAFNLTARTMKMVMANLAVPIGQEENASAMATELYLLNDTMYMKIDGKWTKIEMVGLSLNDVWKQENKMGQEMATFNRSNITLLGSEEIDGVDCYKVMIVPDMNAYVAVQEGQMASPMNVSSLNLSSLFNNTSMYYISWISKDRHLPLKTEMEINMTMTSDMLSALLPGQPAEKAGKFEMITDSSYTIQFNGFDKSLIIVLPEDAKKSESLPLSPINVPAGPSNNVTSINSTKIAK